jgi:anion-transporting  ArsA/GET3 family ATPase
MYPEMESFMNAEIQIVVGTGGVGKTTTAVAMAFAQAKKGKKVLLLTVDPSQRLKVSLGLNQDGQLQEIHHQGVSITACLLNAEKIFNDFVRQFAQKDERIQSLFQNKLYQKLSTQLSGAQEFTSIEFIYSQYKTGVWDLILIDTPPAEQAIDFLKTPQKIIALFDKNIFQWIRLGRPEKQRGFFERMLVLGYEKLVKILESLTGSEFLSQLFDFFQLIEAWQEKIAQRLTFSQQLLHGENTHFILVTSLRKVALQEAAELKAELEKQGYHFARMYLNKAFLSATTMQSKNLVLDQAVLQYYEQKKELMNQFQMDSRLDRLSWVCLPEYEEELSSLEDMDQMIQDIYAALN